VSAGFRARGRKRRRFDHGDAYFTALIGPNTLTSFKVWTDEVPAA